MEKLLLIFSITCFCISAVALLFHFLSNDQKSLKYNYKLNTSNIQFCREVVQWTGPILRERGVKYFPSISIKYSNSPKYFGVYYYTTNSITIYLKKHKGNLAEICSTVLHEVMHHIQSKKDREFKKLLNYKKYGYTTNRIEVEARAFEKKYCQICLIDLCKKGIISKY